METENLVKANQLITEIVCDALFSKAAANDVERFQALYQEALAKALRNQYSEFEELDLTGDMDELLAEAERILGRDLAEKLKPETEQYLYRAFMAGKALRGIPQSIRILFNEAHETALDWMVKNDRFWIGKVFPSNMRDSFKETIVAGMKEGLGRKDIALRLRQATFGQPDMPGHIEAYNRVAAASINRSRSWGGLYSMQEAAVETYQWQAVGDERTCSRCMHLDGMEFRVDKMMSRMGLALAGTPEDIEWVAPWLSHDQAKDDFYILTEAGREYIKDKPASWLESRGIGLPPAHGSCRCQILVV